MNYPIITIPGRPISLKNGKRVFGGRVVWSGSNIGENNK